MPPSSTTTSSEGSSTESPDRTHWKSEFTTLVITLREASPWNLRKHFWVTHPIGSFFVKDKFLFGLACEMGIVEPLILSHQPAKYLHASMDIPTCVLRASVYTAPESIDSIVASSSRCCSIKSASLQSSKYKFTRRSRTNLRERLQIRG